MGSLPLGGQERACPGGVGAAQAVLPFCALLLLNDKLYKIDMVFFFWHLCQRGECLRGGLGSGKSSDSIVRPAPQHTQVYTHTHCILHLTDLEPAAREIVWGILMYMYKPELEAPHPLQNLSLPPQTPTTDVGQVLSIVLNCPCANNYLAPSLPRVWGLL